MTSPLTVLKCTVVAVKSLQLYLSQFFHCLSIHLCCALSHPQPSHLKPELDESHFEQSWGWGVQTQRVMPTAGLDPRSQTPFRAPCLHIFSISSFIKVIHTIILFIPVRSFLKILIWVHWVLLQLARSSFAAREI